MANMVSMVSYGRPYRLISKTGHTVVFEKAKPRMVPMEVMEEAMAVGIAPVDEADVPTEPQNAEPAPPPTGAARKELVVKAMQDLMAANDRGTFTAGGKPRTDALEKIIGFEVDSRERDKWWDELQASLAADGS